MSILATTSVVTLAYLLLLSEAQGPAACNGTRSNSNAALACASNSSLSLCVPTSQNDDLGFCFEAPPGGMRSVSLYSGRRVVYFPLTLDNNSSGTADPSPIFASWPFENFKVQGGASRKDNFFNLSVLYCNGSSTATISPLPRFANNGSFAISLWFKYMHTADTDDNPFLYLLSQGSSTGQEVGLFLFGPPKGNLSGLSRAVLRDGNESDSAVQFYLNSDGSYSADSSIRPGPLGGWGILNPNLLDSAWHHLVLSSPGPSYSHRGMVLFVDGLQSASVPSLFGVSDPVMSDPSSSSLLPGGGRPLNLSSPLTLCGRFTGNPLRTFSGSLAQLTIFEGSLSDQEVIDLWTAGMSSPHPPDPKGIVPTLFDGVGLRFQASKTNNITSSSTLSQHHQVSSSNETKDNVTLDYSSSDLANNSIIAVNGWGISHKRRGGPAVSQGNTDNSQFLFLFIAPIIALVCIIATLLGANLVWKKIRMHMRSRRTDLENNQLLRGVDSSSERPKPPESATVHPVPLSTSANV